MTFPFREEGEEKSETKNLPKVSRRDVRQGGASSDVYMQHIRQVGCTSCLRPVVLCPDFHLVRRRLLKTASCRSTAFATVVGRSDRSIQLCKSGGMLPRIRPSRNTAFLHHGSSGSPHSSPSSPSSWQGTASLGMATTSPLEEKQWPTPPR